MSTKVHFSAGMHLSDAARLLVGAVANGAETAEGEFNGIALKATKGVTVDAICADYDLASKLASESYHASPVGRAADAKQKITARQMQEEADSLMAELPKLDLKSDVEILDWFDRLQNPSDYNGTRFDRQNVIRTFTDAGYEIGANTGDAYIEADRDNNARYLIGQALSCLQSMGAIHGIFGTFHARWKAQFLPTPSPVSTEEQMKP